MQTIDISIVTYNSSKWLDQFFTSLITQDFPLNNINLYIRDNHSTDDTVDLLNKLIQQHKHSFLGVYLSSGDNIGFGSAHNDNFKKGTADFFLVTNVDLTFESASIQKVIAMAIVDSPSIAAWEFRQKPYEHPKFYHPVTGETSWCSSACILFRRTAFAKIGGYDEKLFLYGEDVEISYRLRDNGYQLKYCPSVVCWHYSYQHPNELKPQQFFGSTFANLFIRCRYGSYPQILTGFAMYFAFFIKRSELKDKNKKLFINLKKLIALIPYLLKTRKMSKAVFPIYLNDYDIRRMGAFYVAPKIENDKKYPLVSIVTRTYKGRLSWLNEAIASVLNQTYPNIELIIIEDGSDSAKDIVEIFKKNNPTSHIVYQSIPKGGRCVAGNTGLRLAKGEYVNFLDDDDLLFADHVEILAAALMNNPALGAAYAVAFAAPTEVISQDPLVYKTVEYQHVLKKPFCRVLLWVENYISIQSILFKRDLYINYGGFDTTLDYLEDWDLWVRYSTKTEFFFVEKTTSLYRVPADPTIEKERNEIFRDYYAKAVEKQKNYLLENVFASEVSSYIRKLSLMTILKSKVVSKLKKSPKPIYFRLQRLLRKMK